MNIDYDSSDEEKMDPSLPVSFGKQKPIKSKNLASEDDKQKREERFVEQNRNEAILGSKKIVEVLPTFISKVQSVPKFDNSEFSRLPVSNMVQLQLHAPRKSVYGLSLDPRGSRMVTGGNDGEVRIWDFNGMNEENPTPFKNFFPVEGHTVVDCQFSKTGSHILVACSDSHARVYDRNGKGGVADPSRPGPFEANRPIAVTAKGDQYVAMAENTRGHTHMLSGAAWHPTDVNKFITSSFDCTVRMWDLNGERVGFDQNLKNLHVLKCTDRRGISGGKGCNDPLFVTCCAYSPTDGKIVVAGCSDGSLQLFYEKHKYVKPDSKAQTAHEGASCVGVRMFRDGRRMLSRGTDGTVKLWDVRLLKNSKPVRVWSDLPCDSEHVSVDLSPDESVFLTGTSKGEIVCCDVNDVQRRRVIPIPVLQKSGASVLKTIWHQELNQIIVTASDGSGYMFYDEDLSHNGALLFIGKTDFAAKRRAAEEARIPQTVIAFDDIESHGFKEMKSGKIVKKWGFEKNPIGRYAHKGPEDKQISKNNDKPSRSGPSFITQHVLDKVGVTAHFSEEDSRAALMRVAEKAEATPEFLGPAYQKTQPENILDFSGVMLEGDQLLNKEKYCPKCGLKMCTCGFMAKQSTKRKL